MISLFGKTPKTIGTFHFIGIGGVGMSGLAEFLHECGYHVQGSDASEGVHVKRLMAKGIKFFHGHKHTNVDDAFRVVYSSAISENNPELVEAQNRGIRTMHRSELLAEIANHFDTVAVSGTHGKTTTTALAYTILESAGLNPGVINGGILFSLKNNMKLPAQQGGILVVEADESDGSFTRLNPNHVVVTNIEPEHMDYYGSFEEVLKVYKDFALKSKKSVVLNTDSENTAGILNSIGRIEVTTVGLEHNPVIKAENITQKGAAMVFDMHIAHETIEKVVLHMPGMHNVQNALAAAAVAHHYGVSLENIKKGIAAFAGVGRRFIKIGDVNEAVVIDDYAHHPSEVRATIKAAREGFNGRVVAVFQPHRYTRLRDHLEDFAKAFELADEVILTPVYDAGEAPLPNITSERLMQEIKKNFPKKTLSYAPNHDEAALMVMDNTEKGDVILYMGAGNINQWGVYLVKKNKMLS